MVSNIKTKKKIMVSPEEFEYYTSQPDWVAGDIDKKGKPTALKGQTKDTNAALARLSKKLMGHESWVYDWQVAKEKEYETKKKNKSFNSSKPELQLYEELKKIVWNRECRTFIS